MGTREVMEPRQLVKVGERDGEGLGEDGAQIARHGPCDIVDHRHERVQGGLDAGRAELGANDQHWHLYQVGHDAVDRLVPEREPKVADAPLHVDAGHQDELREADETGEDKHEEK